MNVYTIATPLGYLDASGVDSLGHIHFMMNGSIHVAFKVNQVKDLMSYLQRALDEHGDKTQ